MLQRSFPFFHAGRFLSLSSRRLWHESLASVSVCFVRSQFFCLLLHRICIPPAEERVGKRRFVLLLFLLGRTPPHIECGGEERICCTRRPGIGPELHVNLIKVFFSSVTFVLFLSHVRWSFARQKSSGWYH